MGHVNRDECCVSAAKGTTTFLSHREGRAHTRSLMFAATVTWDTGSRPGKLSGDNADGIAGADKFIT